MINIYTDGACSGNPGIGGWGVVILDNNKEILLNGGDQHTTNNKMELTAAIKALEYFETTKELIIYTDSKYCLLYTSPSPRDAIPSRMPSSA